MNTEYKLEWLKELLTDQLNYKRNSVGELVQAHPYLYKLQFVSELANSQNQELLLYVEKSNRTIPIVRISKNLSTQWYYQRLLQYPWPRGVSEMPTTPRDDEEYELHVYTKYLLENIFSFFWPQVEDVGEY